MSLYAAWLLKQSLRSLTGSGTCLLNRVMGVRVSPERLTSRNGLLSKRKPCSCSRWWFLHSTRMLDGLFTTLSNVSSLKDEIGLMWANSTCKEYPQTWQGNKELFVPRAVEVPNLRRIIAITNCLGSTQGAASLAQFANCWCVFALGSTTGASTWGFESLQRCQTTAV